MIYCRNNGSGNLRRTFTFAWEECRPPSGRPCAAPSAPPWRRRRRASRAASWRARRRLCRARGARRRRRGRAPTRRSRSGERRHATRAPALVKHGHWRRMGVYGGDDMARVHAWLLSGSSPAEGRDWGSLAVTARARGWGPRARARPDKGKARTVRAAVQMRPSRPLKSAGSPRTVSCQT